MAIPNDQLPIGVPGKDPDDPSNESATVDFFIDRAWLDAVRETGPQEQYDNLRFVEEAASQPDAIFIGLERPEHEQSVCYSVRLTRDPHEPDSETPPRFGVVFLIFARVGVGGYVIFDWEFRDEHPDEPGHPERWETDFERRVWSRT